MQSVAPQLHLGCSKNPYLSIYRTLLQPSATKKIKKTLNEIAYIGKLGSWLQSVAPINDALTNKGGDVMQEVPIGTGTLQKQRPFNGAEEVFDQYYDTAGNYHWTGTKTGKHIIKM